PNRARFAAASAAILDTFLSQQWDLVTAPAGARTGSPNHGRSPPRAPRATAAARPRASAVRQGAGTKETGSPRHRISHLTEEADATRSMGTARARARRRPGTRGVRSTGRDDPWPG